MGILQARILSELSRPPPGDLPNLGIEPRSPKMQTDSLLSEPPWKPIDILGGDVKYGIDYMILDFRRKVRTEILNLGDIMMKLKF